MGRRRGLLASIGHAIDQAERAQRRHQRELLARARHVQRLQAAEDREAERAQAAFEVEEFQNALGVLLSVHHDSAPAIDWKAVAVSPCPKPTQVNGAPVLAAEERLASYRPSFFARLFRRVERRRSRLADELKRLQSALRLEEEAARRNDSVAVAEWKRTVAFAKSILSGDTQAYQQALDDSDCFDELNELHCSVNVSWLSGSAARARIRAEESDIVPTEEKSLSARGKLSSKKIPNGRVNEIYQDFICGAALRVARELFALLPLRSVLVDVSTTLLDTSSGRFQEVVVLSVDCLRDRLARIVFERADPSDVVDSLRHSMRFKRGQGLAATDPLDAMEP